MHLSFEAGLDHLDCGVPEPVVHAWMAAAPDRSGRLMFVWGGGAPQKEIDLGPVDEPAQAVGDWLAAHDPELSLWRSGRRRGVVWDVGAMTGDHAARLRIARHTPPEFGKAN